MRTTCSAIIAVALLAGATLGVAAQAEEDPASRPPVPSVGCGSSTVESGQFPDNALEVDDLVRTWAMYVPEAHDGVTPVPLWLHLHGGTLVASTNDVLRVAAEEGFVVVAPQGIRTQMGYDRTWMWGDEDTAIDLTAANPDIALVDALIDEIGAALCIDLARVYAAGWSSGGEASSVLACVLDELIAAVAPVAGAYDLGAACEADRAVPHLSVVGTDDIWFEGLAPGVPWSEHPIPQALASDHHFERIAAVALRHGCEPDPVAEAVMDGVERLTWSCPSGAEVELVLIEDGVHSWQPGWQPDGDWYDTSEAVWEFFKQHPMPE